MLATIAERGETKSKKGRKVIKVIKEYMKTFKEKNINKIILGCTHYPIYEEMMREELEYNVELINTGTTVANYLGKYLKENELENSSEMEKEKIYLTKPEKEFEEIAKNIMNVDVEINQLDKALTYI